MTYTMDLTETYELIGCGNCDITFGMSVAWYRTRRRDHKIFHCPNGHRQYFSGESDLEHEKRLREQAERDARVWRSSAKSAKNSLRSTRGHLTRVKNRIAAGVCPCCNRTFKDLGRHMTNKHPQYSEATT